MSRQPSRQASLACLRLTGLLERLILIHLALAYLLGQAGVAWGWQAAAPLWLGGLLTAGSGVSDCSDEWNDSAWPDGS